MDKRPVKIGLETLARPLTLAQALRYGNNRMPLELKKSGFKTIVFVSDPKINGAVFYRINWGK